jgi:D-alanyl-D-alanine endopeptidase (penicillin-binding protein 7)
MKKLLLTCCLATPLLCTTPTSADDAPLQLARLEQDTQSRHSPAAEIWESLNPRKLKLSSAAALVMDDDGNEVYAKGVDQALPIASITKLMTAMVIIDAGLPMDEKIRITSDDRDLIQLTGSRLTSGATLSRKQLVQLALMSSENRAANALARSWPQGKADFVRAMNLKAARLNMHASRFTDPAGLDAGNVATPHDIARMVRAAMQYPLIRKATTTRSISVYPWKGRGPLKYSNTNRLLRNDTWEIQLSKTGYLNEAGRCLVMQAEIAGQPLVIVLLNSFGKLTPFGDSNRIRKWIEQGTGS